MIRLIHKIFLSINLFLLLHFTLLDLYYSMYKKYAARLQCNWFRKIHQFMNLISYLDLYIVTANLLAYELVKEKGLQGLVNDFNLQNLELVFMHIWFQDLLNHVHRWPRAVSISEEYLHDPFAFRLKIEESTITIYM